MAELSIENLLQLQTARLERIIRHQEIFNDSSTIKTVSSLKQRLKLLEIESNDFRITHDEISLKMSIEEQNSCPYFKDEVYNTYLETYFLLYSEVESQIESSVNENATSTATETVDADLLHVLQNLQVSNSGQIKLPTLQPPTFSGKSSEWKGFFDQFYAMIHTNNKVHLVQKFQYLFAATQGRARDVIKHLPVKESSYESALKLLKEEFDNKRAIFTDAIVDIQNYEKSSQETLEKLRDLYSIIHESMQTLKNIEIDTNAIDPFIAYLTIEKLPDETRKEFEKKIAEKTKDYLPTIKDVTDQIQTSMRTLELIQPNKETQPEAQGKQSKGQSHKSIKSLYFKTENSNSGACSRTSSTSVSSNHQTELKCALCQANHSIRSCPKFMEMSIEDRNSTAKRLNLCFNCLSKFHLKPKCSSRRNCAECHSRHHTLLHPKKTAEEKNESSLASTSKSINTATIETPIFRPTLLATAIILVTSKQGTKIPMKALIDLGGEASAISETAVQTLGLTKKKCFINVDHLDQVQSKSNAVTTFHIHSTNSQFTSKVDALVLKSLIHLLPSRKIFYSNWPHIKNLELADPNFHQIGPIDIILGAEVYGDIVLSEIIKGPQGTPTAQKTELGWILFGKAHNNAIQSISINTMQVNELMQKFFEIEEISEERMFTDEDQYVIDFFNQNYQRDEEGRFIVKFPFRTPIYPEAVLGKSRENALKQFLHLERKFASNPKFKEEYSKNINDYLIQGHMHELFDTESDRRYTTKDGYIAYDCFYLPHHAVIKESSTSTRLRPVFNAEKITSNGNSLNSVLFTGPMLLNDLVSILLNWRFHQIAFIGDIQQMYRQIRVADCDVTYQRILWRNNPHEKLREYGISRLGFGTNYAPCAANQCVKKLADLNAAEFPEASEKMKKDIYMDDIITGCYNVDKSLQIQKELMIIFNSAGFRIKKWASNSEKILAAVPESDREISIPFFINPDKKVKTLARIYDPLGLVSPIIVKAKIFMKSLWLLKLDWNDPLPAATLQEWKVFISKLPSLSSIKIPRWIRVSPNCLSLQLHGFSDASVDAYGASIYLRCTDENGEIHSRIIISKTKVTPMKIQTIPRLELCAALLLTKLIKYTQKCIHLHNFNVSNVFLWCDSQVVLHWLKGDAKKWKTFVANRITKILQTTESHQWRYVSTKENPADLLSRGLFPPELENNELWFYGPKWLRSSENNWPSNSEPIMLKDDELVNELKPIKINVINVTLTPTQYLLHYCADLNQLLRYTAWFRRFFQYLKDKQTVKKEWLSVSELNDANLRWISLIQKETLGKITQHVQNKSKLKHTLSKLNPFMDNKELLRVGGRLSFSESSYDQKHPFILPKESHFSKLIIQHHHQLALHVGVQLTLAEIRQKYWILGGRNPVRSVITKCVTCFRNRPSIAKQLMSNLPSVRVTPCHRPFLHTGVDLCGPVLLRTSKKLGSRIYKGYVVLFICMSVKAVHLEPAIDLSSEAFMMSFQRFIARRGKCSDLYCDCGPNFVGARKLFSKDEEAYLKAVHSELRDKLANLGVNFHFNPPSAPSFGGIWESNIRRTKDHLKRVIGEKSLTYDELATILAKIESCLNSRPLMPMSDDPEDFTYLTPGHFLIGDAMSSVPEPNLLNVSVQLTHRYRAMLKRVQVFWGLWKKSYLHSLQQRQKWLTEEPNLRIGDMVLIKNENFPPLKWLMGRIIQTHPGPDGLIRVCTVKTKQGTYVRPIIKLAPLPIDRSENTNVTSLLSMISKKTFTLAVEGNIGSGKSTLLNYFKKFNKIDILPEPVEKWNNFEGVNLLDLMYKKRDQWMFPFQSYAALTMLQNHSKHTDKKFKLMERSIYSIKNCFNEINNEMNLIHPAQYHILKEMLEFFIASSQTKVDLFIYLRTSPEIALNRIKKRDREEEIDVNLKYLETLHELHEKWLLSGNSTPVIVLNGNLNENQIVNEYRKIEDELNLWGGRNEES